MSFDNRWRDVGLMFVYIVSPVLEVSRVLSNLHLGLQRVLDLRLHLCLPHSHLEALTPLF